MKRKSIILKALLITVGFAWVWLSRTPTGSAGNEVIQAPQAGFTAPDFELKTNSGDQIALRDLRGKIIILNFWASWCPPCRAEMPAFQQIVEEYPETDLIVLGVNSTSQDSLVDVERFVQEYQLKFTIPLDTQGQASRSYHVHSLPTTFFIDRDGVVQKVIVGGPIPLSLLRIEVHQLLQED